MLEQRCLTALLTACYSALRVHGGLLKEMTVSSIADRTGLWTGSWGDSGTFVRSVDAS